MKHHHAAFAVALAALGLCTAPLAAQEPSGAPTSDVPILYNDHHIYATPDRLHQDRVLAALVRGDEVLVPLRSMFEQMGATVNYDSATHTADVSKPGSDVKVTVGKPEVVINGDIRPLDVPPEIYRGAVMVPIRVISESMGAYVQWVPEKKVVVVRYLAQAAPTPPAELPTAAPTPVETPVPQAPVPLIAAQPTATPLPTSAPTAKHFEHFIVGDYIAAPNVSNQFSPNNSKATWGPSYAGRAAIEFSLHGVPLMAEGYGEQYAYRHSAPSGIARNAPCAGALAGNPGCVRTIGGASSVFVPQFQAIDGDVSARIGVKLANPRIYFATAYIVTANNYGYPRTHGFGYGLEKLPDLDRPFSVFGSYYYYPENEGNYTDPTSGASYLTQYRFQQYQVGLTYSFPFHVFNGGGVFFEAGFMGNQSTNKQFLPINGHESGGFAGLGVHF